MELWNFMSCKSLVQDDSKIILSCFLAQKDSIEARFFNTSDNHTELTIFHNLKNIINGEHNLLKSVVNK